VILEHGVGLSGSADQFPVAALLILAPPARAARSNVGNAFPRSEGPRVLSIKSYQRDPGEKSRRRSHCFALPVTGWVELETHGETASALNLTPNGITGTNGEVKEI
jgi:hypothetical protein